MNSIEFTEEGMRLSAQDLSDFQRLFLSATIQDSVRQFGETTFQDAKRVFGGVMGATLELAANNQQGTAEKVLLESRHLDSVKLIATIAINNTAETIRNMCTPIAETEPRFYHFPGALRSLAVAADICLQAYVDANFEGLTQNLK